MYAKIDVELRGQVSTGRIEGSPSDVISLITGLIKDLSVKFGIEFDELMNIISKSYKADELARFGCEQIEKGQMTPLTATAFVNSMLDDLFNNKGKQE